MDDIRPEYADSVAEEVRALGRQAMAVYADVTKRDEVDKMVADAMEKFGHIDILVNNVGGGISPQDGHIHFKDMTPEHWAGVFDKNLISAMHCTQAVLPHMMAQKKGKIIVESSGAALRGGKNETDYCAAKAGLHGFVVGLSHDVVGYGIRANCVIVNPCGDAPSKKRVGLTKEELIKRDTFRLNLPRQIMPEEIAALVAFLASDESDFMNGQTFYTGGLCDY